MSGDPKALAEAARVRLTDDAIRTLSSLCSMVRHGPARGRREARAGMERAIDALAAARVETIERCARVCDGFAGEWLPQAKRLATKGREIAAALADSQADGALQCAAAIRALASEESGS